MSLILRHQKQRKPRGCEEQTAEVSYHGSDRMTRIRISNRKICEIRQKIQLKETKGTEKGCLQKEFMNIGSETTSGGTVHRRQDGRLPLWPMFVTSCDCVAAILLRRRSPKIPKARVRQLQFHFNRKNLARSEERRVGKECRSRW